MKLIYCKTDEDKTHPYTAYMADADGKRITQNVEFRDENQMRCFWMGYYYGGEQTIPVNAVLEEVEGPIKWV